MNNWFGMSDYAAALIQQIAASITISTSHAFVPYSLLDGRE